MASVAAVRLMGAGEDITSSDRAAESSYWVLSLLPKHQRARDNCQRLILTSAWKADFVTQAH